MASDYRLLEVRSMVLLRWLRTAGPAAIDQSAGEMVALAEKGPRGLLVVIPEQVVIPDGPTRERLITFLKTVPDRFQFMALVIEGTGLVPELKRTFVRAVSALGGRKLIAFPSVEAAAAAAPAALVGDVPGFVAAYAQALAAP